MPPGTIIERLEAASRTSSGYRYIRADGSIADQSYVDLLAGACRVAGALRGRDVPPGSLIGIASLDPESFLTAFMGVSAAGLIPSPLQTPAAVSTPAAYFRTLEPTLRVSRTPLVLADAALAARLAEFPAMPPLASIADTLAAPPIDPVHPPPDSVAIVQFTSGSTADPRGVMLTHAALAANAEAIGGPAGLAFSDEDRGVSWLPLYHDMGLVGMALAAMYFTRPTTFLPSLTFLKRPVEWLRTIARERGTVSFAPNFAYDLCLRRITDEDLATLDLSSWRVAGCGAEPIRAETLTAFAERFSRAGFRASAFTPCYGLAEHTLAVTLSAPGRGLRVHPVPGDPRLSAVSCGLSPPAHQIRIVNEEGTPMREPGVGEIEARGPSLMQGYFEDPAATFLAFRDGWLRTGDIGFLSGGELYVCGRVKEMIVLNGRNYFPQDLEWIAGDAPGVRPGKLVALGVMDGPIERLVILVEASGGADRAAMTAGIRRRIADAFGLSVDEVVFAPSGTLQTTTSGKPKRLSARDAYDRLR